MTDANLVAGRINPAYFLGGRIQLDVDAARRALQPVARALSVDVDAAATGVIRLANANMIHLLKLVSVRRGRDPRDFAIVAFGGGGSMHASALARELKVPRVIVPPLPGHFSAWGMLASDLRHDTVQTRFARADQVGEGELDAVWGSLEERLADTFAEEGLERDEVEFVRSADMRYAGQEHTVNVPAAPGAALEEIASSFHELHHQLYTFRLASPIEFVNFRLTGLGSVRKPELVRVASNGDAVKGMRAVDFDELGRHEARIYERAGLGAGALVRGPAVVEEPAASTVVFPGRRSGPTSAAFSCSRRRQADGRRTRAGHRPVHGRDPQGLADRGGGRDVRRAPAHVQEHDHLRGARLRLRPDRRGGQLITQGNGVTGFLEHADVRGQGDARQVWSGRARAGRRRHDERPVHGRRHPPLGRDPGRADLLRRRARRLRGLEGALDGGGRQGPGLVDDRFHRDLPGGPPVPVREALRGGPARTRASSTLSRRTCAFPT